MTVVQLGYVLSWVSCAIEACEAMLSWVPLHVASLFPSIKLGSGHPDRSLVDLVLRPVQGTSSCPF